MSHHTQSIYWVAGYERKMADDLSARLSEGKYIFTAQYMYTALYHFIVFSIVPLHEVKLNGFCCARLDIVVCLASIKD